MFGAMLRHQGIGAASYNTPRCHATPTSPMMNQFCTCAIVPPRPLKKQELCVNPSYEEQNLHSCGVLLVWSVLL